MTIEPATEANSDEAWDNSPEGIADWIRRYDSLEPLLMTPQEEAEAEAWLKKCGEYEMKKLHSEPNLFE